MSLLRDLQQITERTYRAYSGLNLEHFIIGRQGFRTLSALASEESQELSDLARVFFRVMEDRLYMAIYYSEHIISLLERYDPRRGLHEKNIYPFVVFVEEMNHALHAALKFLSGTRQMKEEPFIRDLELLAKVDCYQVLKFFMAYFNPSRRLEKWDRLWIRYHLFERADYGYDSVNLSERYREVNGLGEKYTRYLDALRPEDRISELRSFRQFDYGQKQRYIHLLP